MLNFIKKYLSLLKQDFKLFTILSIPGLIFYFVGLNQLEAFNWLTVTFGTLNKFAVEFLTISIFFYILHVIGFKKRWVFALMMFLYYITITADIVLLAYFKERFGAKYLSTLEGGQYAFLLDIRFFIYFIVLYSFPYFTIKRNWHRSSRHTSAKKIAVAAVLMLIVSVATPLNYLKSTDAFYASQLMNTTVAEIIKDLVVKKYPYQEYGQLPQDLQALADEYNLFKPATFKNKKQYDRVILLTTEALSNKFISSFNPEIPVEASYVLDGLVTEQPYASLKHSALSTLYGLSVIFSGHPNPEMIYKNEYPLSFVKVLKDNGFKTAFIRGADEEYMDEHIIFRTAGFNEVYGAKYFEQQPQYSNYVEWWGLTDRKLFDFTVNYLKEHRKEKVFINILTVDTHVPSGRADYLDQEYPPIDDSDISRKTKKIYKRTNMARAFARFNYDLERFIQTLEEQDLLDDKTLLIITGDHPFFANVDTGHLFKNYRPVFDEVPFILVTKNGIEESIATDLFKSQQDIAPTILGLTGLPVPQGMFGRSIFEDGSRTVFYMKNNYVVVTNTKGTKVIPFTSNKPQDKALLRLLNSTLK